MRDVNEGAWPCAESPEAPAPRLATARRKDDVMQMRGRARVARAPPPPSGVSVLVFSSGESQTGFHRESLQITSILARRKQNLYLAGSTSLFLSLSSPFLFLSFPTPSPFPPPYSLSGVSVYGNQRPPHLYTLKGKKHLWLGEKEGKKKREREREEKLAWLWKMTLEVAKPAARVESIVS